MATVHVVLCRVSQRGDIGGALPVPESVPQSVDTVTSSGTSQLASVTASVSDVWSVTSTGNVWLKFGTGTPIAGADDGWLHLAGRFEYGASTDAEKLAIKDA